MRPRVFPAEDLAGFGSIDTLVQASMRPRVFPAEDLDKYPSNFRAWQCFNEAAGMGAFPISRSRAHTHRRHGHPLQTVPSAGLIERPQEKNRVDALR